jgi:hydrogenase nickel incorporation protein HypA/HybF
MAMTEKLIDVVENFADGEGCQRIRVVRIEIGKLSGVEPAMMHFCFDAVARGTAAENAVLEISEVEGNAWCFDCRRQVPLAARFDPCPRCGGVHLQPMDGTRMRVKEMEVE